MDTMDTKTGITVVSRIVILGVLGVLCGGVAMARAQGGFAMPDAKEMSGIPRPVDDLPNAAVLRLVQPKIDWVANVIIAPQRWAVIEPNLEGQLRKGAHHLGVIGKHCAVERNAGTRPRTTDLATGLKSMR